MSVMQTTTTRRDSLARQQLHKDVRSAAQRGRLLASFSVVLLCAAAFVGGLFVVAIKDALFNLPEAMRLALFAVLLLGVLAFCVVLGLRPWFRERYNRAAGEQIDYIADRTQQPVTVGLSLNEPMDDDTLALKLIERAEARAADVAKTVKPKQAYPLRRLRAPGSWLGLALGLWLLLVLILPSQAFAMFARVLMPWSGTPPFSLTQLDPTWTPEPPGAGDDVLVEVAPTGLMPDLVDWVLLDGEGEELERFAMVSDGQGGFSHLVKRVESPIDFRLEANGRYTRRYTITPTPRPLVEEEQGEASAGNAVETSEGTTTFDPDKVARRDLDAHEDWPALKQQLRQFIDELADVQALAEKTDPLDAEAMRALAEKIKDLIARGDALAGELAEVQGELPADAAALLDELAAALSNMQSAALPAMPASGEPSPGSGEPTPAQWLQQAIEAAKQDQEQIGLGIGPSELPTESGIGSGNQGQSPDLVDPNTSGTYRETNTSGDEGPLPDAAMQQVPPSYRDFVAAYFDRLAEEQDKP